MRARAVLFMAAVALTLAAAPLGATTAATGGPARCPRPHRQHHVAGRDLLLPADAR